MKVLNKKSIYKPDDLGFRFQHVPLEVKRIEGKFKCSSKAYPSIEPVIANSQSEAIQDFKSKLLEQQQSDELD